MQDQQNAKQQIVDRLRQATNILVTVQNNPTVDELAAALAFTLMLNKMDKHATAVFSGAVPPAISFLEPQKTFEHSVDSLRDFIIALDKEKADRLRYKVEDDVVKIFITPYRSIITKDDLQFSQGDFNVEVIVALGVEKREDLDRAIVAHGRILHDATVVTINASNQQSSLGAVDWQDGTASSISEMLFSLSEALQPNVLDQQISTALLTGIVAATERFSNQRTTPRVMTMAAQLMASGANQQLIANNLTQQTQPAWAAPQAPKQDEHISQKLSNAQVNPDGEMKVTHPGKAEAKPIAEVPALATAEPAQQPAPTPTAAPTPEAGLEELKKALQNATPAIAPAPPAPAPEPTPAPAPAAPEKPAQPKQERPPKVKKSQKRLSEKDEPQDQSTFTAAADDEDKLNTRPSWQANRLEPPTMGGTLNATTATAEDDARKAEDDARNRTLLSHDSKPKKEESAPPQPATPPAPAPEPTPAPAPAAPEKPEEKPMPEPAPAPTPVPAPVAAPEPEPAPVAPAPPAAAPAPELAKPQQEQQAPEQEGADLEAARRAVSDALSEAAFNPAEEPLQAVGSQPLGGELHPSQAPAPAEPVPAPEPTPAPMAAPASTPAPLPSPTQPQVPLPPMPPMPDFNTLPPLPPMPGQPAPAAVAGSPEVPQQQQPMAAPVPAVAPVATPAPTPAPAMPSLPQTQSPTAPAPGQVEVDPNNPAQFQIPGQQ